MLLRWWLNDISNASEHRDVVVAAGHMNSGTLEHVLLRVRVVAREAKLLRCDTCRELVWREQETGSSIHAFPFIGQWEEIDDNEDG